MIIDEIMVIQNGAKVTLYGELEDTDLFILEIMLKAQQTQKFKYDLMCFKEHLKKG